MLRGPTPGRAAILKRVPWKADDSLRPGWFQRRSVQDPDPSGRMTECSSDVLVGSCTYLLNLLSTSYFIFIFYFVRSASRLKKVAGLLGCPRCLHSTNSRSPGIRLGRHCVVLRNHGRIRGDGKFASVHANPYAADETNYSPSGDNSG